ncbi:hypothetical protein [Glycomyces algeriensis]|uniref:tRNA nuclease CdiA C-terminal domain-containing protein n=1 Tax=Glycomyces algeriensis TaxID=256037 RepID=A0A9W6G5Q0_9ACTN|nr:hypothetical protein [Glycomyces algeriensis]MDA1367513.1 hypothetical protein [Glycomyces algeriensis]MDR7353124.1 hypothetical protein [Glycomyces algeriensis]GLI40817.1 hypothetical protein GALLR39Z86_06670 [Glycomyces algeriensis]
MRRALKLLLLIGIGLALAGNRPNGPNGTPGNFDKVDIPPKYKGLEGNSTAENHDAIEGKLEDGDPSGNGKGADESSDGDSGVVDPSGTPDPSNRPTGPETELAGTADNRRSLTRENESAVTLAQNGFDVEQNPPGRDNGKNPDYKIEGTYFDCYAPTSGSPGNIMSSINKKVSNDQASHIVLNLDDSSLNPADLRARLERYPISGLEEIKIIKDGQVINFYP